MGIIRGAIVAAVAALCLATTALAQAPQPQPDCGNEYSTWALAVYMPPPRDVTRVLAYAPLNDWQRGAVRTTTGPDTVQYRFAVHVEIRLGLSGEEAVPIVQIHRLNVLEGYDPIWVLDDEFELELHSPIQCYFDVHFDDGGALMFGPVPDSYASDLNDGFPEGRARLQSESQWR